MGALRQFSRGRQSAQTVEIVTDRNNLRGVEVD